MVHGEAYEMNGSDPRSSGKNNEFRALVRTLELLQLKLWRVRTACTYVVQTLAAQVASAGPNPHTE